MTPIHSCLCLQILFRSGVLNELEAKRDVLLSDRIIQLQAFCRGYLARKKMSQRRIQVSLNGLLLIIANRSYLYFGLIFFRNSLCAAYNAM